MIKYGDLVQYIKENHINWNTDLFDVLRGFFSQYSPQPKPSPPVSPRQEPKPVIVEASLDFGIPHVEFHPPTDGEYSAEDVLNLFST